MAAEGPGDGKVALGGEPGAQVLNPEAPRSAPLPTLTLDVPWRSITITKIRDEGHCAI